MMASAPHCQTDRPSIAAGRLADSFTLTVCVVLGVALTAAALIAPVAAMLVGMNWHFPFPRIFDRTVMVTLFAALLLFAPNLNLLDHVREGFRPSEGNLRHAIVGLAMALAAMAILFALGAIAVGHVHTHLRQTTQPGVSWHGTETALRLGLRYLPAAILIAVLEEGFFRAFLLAGMASDFGWRGALFASSAVFAVVHIVRSPARFYLVGFHPAAGVQTLAASAERLAHPETIAGTLLGLFLLGLVLGQAFVLTGRVYCSLGLHAGFIVGAKTWRLTAVGPIPRWLVGPAPVPLISAPAAWVISAIMLLVLHLWLEPGGRVPAVSNRRRAAFRGDGCDSGDGSKETVSGSAAQTPRLPR
jgi:membrane protease YdiL (CAAX protease family)